jgi:hypothetical protein
MIMSTLSHSRARALGIAVALAAVAMTGVLGLQARDWVGRTFPGLLVLPNGVVASVGAPSWIEGPRGALYQREIVAVDGRPVAGAGDVYARVADRRAGEAFVATVRDGARETTVTLPARIFTELDYWTVFGAYLGTGLLYVLAGLLGLVLLADTPIGGALCRLGVVAGTYAFSAVGIYDTAAALYVHVVAEALLPAALVAVALALSPTGRRLAALAVATRWLSIALAVPYVLLAHQPAAYATLHAACEAYMGAAGLFLVACLVVERTRQETLDPLTRFAGTGALLGIGVPAVVFALSGTCGGLPVNVCTTTGFLFPLGVAWGLARLRPVPAPLRAG